MNLICENYLEKKYERRIESFEKETLLGIFEIINKMHKHSIEDYKNVIDYHLNDENGEITDSMKFEKVYSEQFHLMFDDIAEEFQHRLKTLKHELIKRLDIKKRDIKKLQVITEENESENECDNESIPESLKSLPFITIGKHKLFGQNNPLKNLSEEQIDEVLKNAKLMRRTNTLKELK